MEIKKEIIDDNKKNNNILSISFFIIVMIITLGLFTYNYTMDKSILSLNKDINTTSNSIAEINKNRDIHIYKLIEINRHRLSALEHKSNITSFISHLNDIKSQYGVNLRGFNYNNGLLNSSVTISNNDEAFSYNVAKDFIYKYRNDKSSKFDLGFISSVSGNDKINFDISLTLKDYTGPY